MVDCAGLENRRAERFRGFESHPLRHLNPLKSKDYRDEPNEIYGGLSIAIGGGEQITRLGRRYAEREIWPQPLAGAWLAAGEFIDDLPQVFPLLTIRPP